MKKLDSTLNEYFQGRDKFGAAKPTIPYFQVLVVSKLFSRRVNLSAQNAIVRDLENSLLNSSGEDRQQ